MTSTRNAAIRPDNFAMALMMILGIATGCSTETSPQVEKLRWLKNVTADEMFQRDRDAGKLKLYTVCGIVCRIPAAENSEHRPCIAGHPVTHIEGTTDAIESSEHERLIQRAWEFAENYNRLVVKHSKQRGSSAVCS